MNPVLTSLTDFKRRLGMPDSDVSLDATLQTILVEVEAAVGNRTRRVPAPGRNPFESVSATEYYDGSGRSELVLNRRPVTSVTNVWLDSNGAYGHGSNAFGTGTVLTLGTDYAPRSLDATENNPGILVALSGCWPEGQGNIKVTYTAGYATTPADLQLAIYQLAASVYQGAEKGGLLAGETLGDYTWRLAENGSSMDMLTARSILARYTD